MGTASGDAYDPALEYPGDISSTTYSYGDSGVSTAYTYSVDQLEEGELEAEASGPSRAKHATIFRLVVDSSSILHPKHRIAILDGYPTVEIGRDAQAQGSTTPRLRLKELEVSKIHATAYWDGARKEWNIVDMGSKHGTFVRAAADPQNAAAVRLSQSRAASLPRRLSHADSLAIGGTVFTVHIHDDVLACVDCSFGDPAHEIPLFPKKSGVKRTREDARIDEPVPAMRKVPAKRALNSLRSELLSRSSASPLHGSSKEYVDRSARRRALQPTPHAASPGVQLPRVESPVPPRPGPTARPPPSWEPPPRPRTPTSAPPVPISMSSIGHKLLMKQGWEPGTALGTGGEEGDRMALLEPLQTVALSKRAGLGSSSATPTSQLSGDSNFDWKEDAQQRRWRSAQS